MSFNQLYDFCQTLEPVKHNEPIVHQNVVKNKALELTGIESIRTMMDDLDASRMRGYYLSAENKDHQFVKQTGGAVIVLARGMNRCWKRFTYVKELMHVFDREEELVSSPESFEKVLSEITTSTIESPQGKSETKGFWMALSVLCPEKHRLLFEELRMANQIDDYAIALQLRIPELYVPHLFSPKHRKTIDNILQP